MNVRDTSAESHAIGGHDSLKHRIRVFIREKGPVTRRTVAKHFGVQTATVSGIITPLVNKGLLDETFKAPDPDSGRNVYWLESTVEQLRLPV